MALATLSVDLVARMASYEADMGRAARVSEQAASKISAVFGGIKAAAAGLVAGIGVGGVIALTRSAIDSVDALNDLKDATGASIENISALEDVAARTGTSFDTVGAALVKFNAALKDSKPGSDIANSFDAIGLSVDALKQLDPAEALRQTAVALAGFADDGTKARIVQELFGKSVKEVAPFLKDLAEQGRLVATVTTQQAEEAEKFNKEIFQLQKNAQDLARTLAIDLVTALNATAAKFREGAKAGEGFIVTMLRQTEIARLLGLSQPGGGQTGGASGSFADAGGGRGFTNPAFVKPRILDPFGGSGAKPVPRGPRSTPVAKEEITDAQRALARYVESLQSAIDRTQDLTETEKALNFLRFQGSQGQIPQVRELVLGLAAQIDSEKTLSAETERRIKLKRELAIAEGDAVDAANAALASQRKALDGQINELSGRAGDDRKRELTGRLTELLNSGSIFSADELDRIVRGIGGVNVELEKSKTLAEELGLSFSSAFEDAIVGGKGLGDVLKGLEKDILRIVTRKMVTEPLGNALTGALGGSGGIGGFFGNIFGKLFSADGGGFTGNGPRSGGVDGRGGFLMVGHPNETIVDHSRGQRSGNTVNVTVNQSFGAGTSRATSLQAAADASRALQMAGRNL